MFFKLNGASPKMFAFFAGLAFVLGLSLSSAAQSQTAYNEIFTSEGQIRPEYSMIYQLWQERFADNQDQYLSESRRSFQGDNALDSMPRLLLAPDYDRLKQGVIQRGRAIRAFLKDHYSGRKYYAQSGTIPTEVVDRIVARTGEAGFAGLVNPATLSFFYGPDLIRDPNGHWRVIEDNLGFIGGLGDLHLAQKLTLEAYPEINDSFSIRRPDDFYRKLAQSYKMRAQNYGGKAILYLISTYAADNEEKRIQQIFTQEGIEVVTPDTVKQLKVRDDGVYLELRDGRGKGSAEKVGFIFLNAEHAWVDPSHPASQQRTVLDEASAALKNKKINSRTKSQISEILATVDPVTKLPSLKRLAKILETIEPLFDRAIVRKNAGLLDAILKNKVGTNYSPGVDFTGDKEFYVYVEALIRLYLHEEPILENLPTQKFASDVDQKLNVELLNEVLANISKYVIKKVDGRGGDSVWVGPKIKSSELKDLETMIRSNPSVYIVQEFTPLSVLNGNIVDLRVISDVSQEGVLVADSPWGRGLPQSGNGKVNLSDKGREITVLVGSPKAPVNLCSRVLH